LPHIGRPVPSTPTTSRMTPSVTKAVTPRFTMRAHRMSPEMPASCTPMASATATQPVGMSSIAARVEIGEAHDSGVARSSRDGTKRNVNAGPTTLGWPGFRGLVPRIQMLRRPFLSRMVVMVAVDIPLRTSVSSWVSVMQRLASALDEAVIHRKMLPVMYDTRQVARPHRIRQARARYGRSPAERALASWTWLITGDLMEDKYLSGTCE
jgi:hypothetical protein